MEFVNTKKQIVLYMNELEHIPDTSFERDVVCEDEEAFCLSQEHMGALRDLLQKVRLEWIIKCLSSLATFSFAKVALPVLLVGVQESSERSFLQRTAVQNPVTPESAAVACGGKR